MVLFLVKCPLCNNTKKTRGTMAFKCCGTSFKTSNCLIPDFEKKYNYRKKIKIKTRGGFDERRRKRRVRE